MSRLIAALFVASFIGSAQAQGVLDRAGNALENAGRNIRQGVENAVARGEAVAAERELAGVVSTRVRSDKRLLGSAITMEVRADGAVTLRGSVVDAAAKTLVTELVENTIGVTAVVDELTLAKDVKVIEARPAAAVIEVRPAPKVIISEPAPKVIVKP